MSYTSLNPTFTVAFTNLTLAMSVQCKVYTFFYNFFPPNEKIFLYREFKEIQVIARNSLLIKGSFG